MYTMKRFRITVARRLKLAGVMVVAMFAMGVSATSAFALPDVSVTLVALKCYEISNFVTLSHAGWWGNNTCTTKAGLLDGKWETALPEWFLEANLWCAKADSSNDGVYTNNHCTETGSGDSGKWIEVVVPEAYPLHLNYENTTIKSKLETTAGSEIEGEGLKFLLLFGELTALGTFRAEFKNATEPVEPGKCNSSGDTTGVILTEGSFHVVYTNLSPLLLGILFLPKETVFTCGSTNEKVKGSVISSLNGIGSETTELTSSSGKLGKGSSAGTQEIKEFYNDGGTKVKAKLEGNLSGTGFKEANEVVEGEPVLTALESKMFVITGR
jgi:hypothetical protein